MTELATDWIVVGTAGATADGRNIPEDWIDEAVEIYSVNEYPALIWPFHERWFDMGKVLEIRADNDDKGRRVMLARLEPDSYLIDMSKSGTFYSSMEFSEKNFAGTGKRALVGLGVTNEPASLGVEQLKFSKQENPILPANWQAIESFGFKENAEEKAPNWFAGWAAAFKHKEQDDDTMNKDDKAEIVAAIGADISKAFKQLEETLNEKFGVKYKESPPNEPKPKVDEVQEPELDKQFEALTEQFAALTEQFNTLKSTPLPGTDVPENAGDVNEEVYT